MADDTSFDRLDHACRDPDTGQWQAGATELDALLNQAQEHIDRERWAARPADEVALALGRWWPGSEAPSAALWLLVAVYGRADVLEASLARDPWHWSRLVRHVLAHQNLSPGQVATFAERVALAARGDLAAGMITEPFERWAERWPDRAVEALRLRPDLPPDAGLPLLVHAVRGGLSPAGEATVRVWQDPGRSEHALFLGALSELVAQKKITRRVALDLLEPSLFGEWIPASLAWHSLKQFLKGGDQRSLSLLGRLVADPRPEMRMAVAHYLAATGGNLLARFGPLLLLNALDTDLAHTGVIHNLDLLLARHSHGAPEFVGPYLEQWVDRHPQVDARELLHTSFKSTAHHVQAQHPHLWSRLAGTWLAGSPKLFHIADHLLADHHDTVFAPTPMVEAQCAHLIGRILCTSVGGTVQLALLAQLEPGVTAAGHVQILQDACRELAVNYPRACQAFEASHAVTNPHMVAALRDTREAYFTPRLDRTALLEFAPPLERRRRWQAHARRAQRAIQERVMAEGDFVFTQLATSVSVGRGEFWSVTQHDGTLGGVQAFSRFSHEFEFARLELLEPEDATRRRYERLHESNPEAEL